MTVFLPSAVQFGSELVSCTQTGPTSFALVNRASEADFVPSGFYYPMGNFDEDTLLQLTFGWTATTHDLRTNTDEPLFEAFLECTIDGLRDYGAVVSKVANRTSRWGSEKVELPIRAGSKDVFVGIRCQNSRIHLVFVRDLTIAQPPDQRLLSPSELSAQYSPFVTNGWFGQAFMDALTGASEVVYTRVLKDGGDSIDVGANAGIHTSRLLKLAVRTHSMVVAIEPHPILFRRLQDISDGNEQNYITFLNVAADDSNLDAVPFYYSPDFDELGSLHQEHITHNFPQIHTRLETYYVAALTIDRIARDYALSPKFIKIDVEGCEFRVFQGAIETLYRTRPVVAFEFNAGASADSGWDIYGLLKRLGYFVIDCLGNVITETTWANPIVSPIDRFAIPLEDADSVMRSLPAALQEYWSTHFAADSM